MISKCNLAPTVNPDLQEKYDGYYQSGVDEWRWICAQAKAKNIVNICQHIKHDSILEVGAGEGSVLQALSDAGFGSHLFALEISDSGVSVIRERNIPKLIEISKFEGYHIPYETKRFDLAVATHVLEHVEHERLFLKEVSRVSKIFFIEVPLEDRFFLAKDYHPNSIGHINFYNLKSVRRLIQSCNIEVLDQVVVDLPIAILTFSGKLKGLVKFLARRIAFFINKPLAQRAFVYHCCLLCREESNNDVHTHH